METPREIIASEDQPTPSSTLTTEASALVAMWKKIVLKKFADAEGETNPMGKRLIEHGAMCYFNVATELEDALRRCGA